MKNILSILMVMLPILCVGQTLTENYIKSTTYKVETLNGAVPNDVDKIESIVYLDGLGRPIQQIAAKGSGSGRDVITPITYDLLGRKTKDYLPYINQGQGSGEYSLNLRDNDAITSILPGYYNSQYPEDSITNFMNPYGEQVLEASPLNRVFEIGAPGSDWTVDPNSDADHTIKMDYLTNVALDDVKLFSVVHPNGNTETISLLESGTYLPSTLHKIVTKDENWVLADIDNHTTHEYKDKLGRLVLKRNFDLNESHDTYYVYDDFGNLTYVLPPLTFEQVSISQQVLDDICYQYKYDHRNRLVEKKIPGKGWEYIVYDKLDRVVMTQDANLRLEEKWSFTKYDVLGRIVYSGLVADSEDRWDVQQNISGSTLLFENKTAEINAIDGAQIYYTNDALPNDNGTLEILTVNYYDDYEVGNQVVLNPANGAGVWEGMEPSAITKGLPTVSRVKVLGTDKWITSAIYYDEKGRAWETFENNEYLNTTDWVLNKIDFVGKVLKTFSMHINNGVFTSINDVFTYDDMDRLLTHTQMIGNENPELIVSNEYDELGRLIKKNVGNELSNPLQEVDLKYNVRGWLKEINDVDDVVNLDSDLFNFKINYNLQEGGVQHGALYNGNISQTIWRTAGIDPITNISGEKRSYSYDYDALNRIKRGTARKGEGLSTYTRYHLRKVTYDKNGNITQLHRDGKSSIVDSLTYYYQGGNQLYNVTDDVSQYGGEGFEDRNVNSTFDPFTNDYSYDANGNMVRDLNKEIADIKYNHLNLPVQISFSDGSKIRYVYDAVGIKIQKIVQEAGNPIIAKTIYAGAFQYKSATDISNNVDNYILTFLNQPEGYVEPEFNPADPREIIGYNYTFQYKDHLGNIRLTYEDIDEDGSIDPATEIKEENHYYPFGLKHQGYNSTIIGRDHNYGYNGIEEGNELGNNMLEMDMRQYDPAIARWVVIDPVTHYNFSPYQAFDNNPIFFADPSGADSYPSSSEEAHDMARNSPFYEFMPEGRFYSNASGNGGTDPIVYKGPGVAVGPGVVNQLEAVVITGSNNNNRTIDIDMAVVAQTSTVVNHTVSNTLPHAVRQIPNLTKNDFLLGRIDPKFATDFNNVTPSTVMGNVYEKGADDALNSLNKLKVGAKYVGYFGNAVGYIPAAIEAYNGNYGVAATEAASTTTSIGLSSVVGWWAGAGWSIGWEGGRLWSQTETYNRIFFGKNSRIYEERGIKYGWYSAKLTEHEKKELDKLFNN